MRYIIGFDLVDWESFVAYGIHIKIDPAVVVENEIADSIGPLNREGITVPGFQEPGILDLEKSSSFIIRPKLKVNVNIINHVETRTRTYLVLKARVGLETALLRANPNVRDGFILRGLVKDSGYLRIFWSE